MKKIKRGAELFVENMKNNPKDIIAWAEREIIEYKKLIKIVKKKV